MSDASILLIWCGVLAAFWQDRTSTAGMFICLLRRQVFNTDQIMSCLMPSDWKYHSLKDLPYCLGLLSIKDQGYVKSPCILLRAESIGFRVDPLELHLG